jgi:hypothetical protein
VFELARLGCGSLSPAPMALHPLGPAVFAVR